MRVRKAKDFDSLSFALESGEFQAIMTALDYVAEINKKENPDYSTELEKTKETIVTSGCFEAYKEIVHARLDYDELQNVMEALCVMINRRFWLPYFKRRIKSET